MTPSNPTPSFGGFTEENLQLVRLPETFFTDLLPDLKDLSQLRLLLYLFWHLEQQTGAVRSFSRQALTTDSRLLTMVNGKEGLEDALRALVKKNILLEVKLPSSDDRRYFINGPQGRAAMEAMAQGEWKPPPAQEKPIHLTRQAPNLFRLYEENIGPLTPMLAEILKADEVQYPASWIEDAIRIAVTRNARNWKYVQAILERWQKEGRGNEQNRRDDPQDPGSYRESWLGHDGPASQR